jgi:hypothetical protein
MYRTGAAEFLFLSGRQAQGYVSSAGVAARGEAGVQLLQMHRLGEAADMLQLQRLGDAAATQPASVK